MGQAQESTRCVVSAMLPLVKIPCILVAMVGLQIAITPPHPPPSEEEKAASTRLEVVLKQRSGPLVVKSICWGTAFVEIAVILANHAPSLPLSKTILSSLIFANGSAERIHPSPLFFVGSFLTALGGWIRFKCYRALGSLFTYEMTIRKDHTLVTSGPYAIVRHPGYAGILVTVVGMLLLHGAKGSWFRESGALETRFMGGITAVNLALVFTITIGLLKRMSKEDAALQQRCGQEWESWAKRVPYKLIPGLF